MNIYKEMTQLFSNRKLPWRVSNFLNTCANVYNFYLRCAVNFICFRRNQTKAKIVFCCGFHGFSGGPIAISAIANMLSEKYDVYFVTFPTSNYNKLLNKKIKLLSLVDYSADIFIADEGCDHTILSNMRSATGKLIITCHCLRELLTGLTPEYIYQSFSYADEVHFVGGIQQDDFKLERPGHIIPNSCDQVNKNVYGKLAGTVGRLTDPDKNALLSFSIAENSGMTPFHLWGANSDDFPQKNAIVHGWESDKQKIYNSIDVLVFLSRHETFGLVVIEAMSAGIPCLVSDIPAFQQYRDCPGIEFVNIDDPEGAEDKLKYLMEHKNTLREQMIAHWRINYSSAAVSRQWGEFIENTLAKQ